MAKQPTNAGATESVAPAKKSYKVVGVVPGIVKYRGIEYDLSKLEEIEEATLDHLADQEGFPYLQIQ